MSEHGKYGMPPKKKGHGAKGYWVVGEGYYEQDGSDQPAPEPEYGDKPTAMPTRPAMKFCRMFPNLDSFKPERAKLELLGEAMADVSAIGMASDNPPDSPIPAGFTYFGQFVDHDISRTEADVGDAIAGVRAADPLDVDNIRTASLDLDALYGKGPGQETFYADATRFLIGTADAASFGNAPELPNDLPRGPQSAPDKGGPANIGDNRNDENLAVAQTHLALLKFHNKVADDGSQPDGFGDVRRVVRQHYQSIVWHDFVSRLVDPAIYADIETNGRNWYRPSDQVNNDDLCMPLEFSVAAYRLGHAMVRNSYEWNRVFQTGGQAGIATLVQLFQFSGGSGNLSPSSPAGPGNDHLPANWVANWNRLYDFAPIDGASDDKLNFARPLNTVLAAKLGDLEEFRSIPEPALRNLAVRNLLRGSQLGLPTGQAIAQTIGATMLDPADIAAGPHGKIIKDNGFDTETPLWFYILKEAELQHQGNNLGDVGSTIVAETFHGLIDASEDSIFAGSSWTTSLPSVDPNKFTMTDMLHYVDDRDPLAASAPSV